ncbi:MAG: alpha-galactosidase [Caldilineaceae bacterium]|nr:alpha-galactosidase [Caldilineaceae bacterium]
MLDIVKQSELAVARNWCRESFFVPTIDSGRIRFPIAFRYGEQPSATLLPNWTVRRETPQTADGITAETIVFTDPFSALEYRCEIMTYHDYPAVEWVVTFKNTGVVDTPILSDIQPLDVLFPLDAGAPCQVHHARGGLTQQDDFEPLETPLTFRQGGSRLKLSALTGKSSTLHLPFFNLEMGQNGVIGAIGWSGGWTATFQRERDGVQVQAGMERTHLRLHPGEEIRTPRILLLFWQGTDTPDGIVDVSKDRMRSHNMLRRLLFAHYTPRPNGQPLQPPFCEGVWGAQPDATHLEKIRWLKENRIPTECYWIDAGWYGDGPIAEAADGLSSGWMRQVGSWFPNSEAYPGGFKPIGDAARAAGLGFLLWIEPERAFEGTQMVREHPDWLIGPVPSGNANGANFMVNLGIPEARRHITDLVSGLIDAGGITCYRQDFNDLRMPELLAMADAPDRVGMTEIGHITGLYAFWDDLLVHHPGLIIDNCAGGGQRIDLETIMRSVPLWRSDLQCWPFDPLAMQTQTQGLAPWIPLSAAVCDVPTQYALRSALGPGLVTHWSPQALDGGIDLPVEAIRPLMDEALAMRKYFYGDFYPLLSFSLAADAWAAWQYDRPDLGEGMIVAFRRHASPFPRWEAKLQGLDPDANYGLVSWDNESTRRMTGKALMTDGFVVTIGEKPGTALFTYRRVS